MYRPAQTSVLPSWFRKWVEAMTQRRLKWSTRTSRPSSQRSAVHYTHSFDNVISRWGLSEHTAQQGSISPILLWGLLMRTLSLDFTFGIMPLLSSLWGRQEEWPWTPLEGRWTTLPGGWLPLPVRSWLIRSCQTFPALSWIEIETEITDCTGIVSVLM